MFTREFIVPIALRDDANQLAAAKGQSMADLLTFRRETHEGYSVVQAQVSEEWMAGIGTLERPDFDTESTLDMQAAASVLQGAVVLTDIPESLTVAGLVIGPPGIALALGLVPVASED